MTTATVPQERPQRVRQGIVRRASLRRDADLLGRELGRLRRRQPDPSAGYAAIRLARVRASTTVTAIAEHLHDGTRDAPAELVTAIDRGDTTTICRIEAAWLDREMGPGTGSLYLRVHGLLHQARLLERAQLHNLAVRILDQRITDRTPITIAGREVTEITVTRGQGQPR